MDLKIVSARERALRKSFIKRAVVTETWSDVSPFGDEGLEGCAARGVSADGHRSEGAAMIALPARKNPIAFLLAIFKMKLARKFYGGFFRLGAPRREKKAGTAAENPRRPREEARGQVVPPGRGEVWGGRARAPRRMHRPL